MHVKLIQDQIKALKLESVPSNDKDLTLFVDNKQENLDIERKTQKENDNPTSANVHVNANADDNEDDEDDDDDEDDGVYHRNEAWEKEMKQAYLDFARPELGNHVIDPESVIEFKIKMIIEEWLETSSGGHIVEATQFIDRPTRALTDWETNIIGYTCFTNTPDKDVTIEQEKTKDGGWSNIVNVKVQARHLLPNKQHDMNDLLVRLSLNYGIQANWKDGEHFIDEDGGSGDGFWLDFDFLSVRVCNERGTWSDWYEPRTIVPKTCILLPKEDILP